ITLGPNADAWAARADSTRRDYPWVTPMADGGTMDSLPVAPIAPSRGYGLGPREQRWLVSASWAREGKSGGLAYAGTDPVGKLTWLLQGQWGDRASWRGASIGAAFRGSRPLIGAELFTLDNRPSRQHDFVAPAALDARYGGGSVWTEHRDDRQSRALDMRALASYGVVDPLRAPSMRRALAKLSLAGALLQTPGDWLVRERLGAAGTVGRTGGDGWRRAVVTGALSVTGMGHELALDGMYGRVSRTVAYEAFALGGLAPAIVDSTVLDQRVSMPVLPIGVATGIAVATFRASLPGEIWRPYFWVGSANDVRGAWSQVVGIEGAWQTDGIWMVRVPGVRLLGGIGYSLTGAARHHAQAYLSVGYRP
ncbi:MAG: hypothetical protein JJD97_10630, partial [Gemmatimonadaceae bacterium]|nr:hypothetical protein [Gemmatimonadaceae bacterium]